MKIEDHRVEHSWVPAIPILEEFLPKLDKSYFIGIKSIFLFDKDYHKDKKVRAAARYVPVYRTKFANIEIYFDHFDEFPELMVS